VKDKCNHNVYKVVTENEEAKSKVSELVKKKGKHEQEVRELEEKLRQMGREDQDAH